MSAYLLACALCCYVPLALLAPPYFGAVFGAEWHGAGALVPWLALASAAALITSPVSSILQVLRCQHLKWIYDAASIALLIGAVRLAPANDVHGTIALLSTAGALSCAVYYCVLLYSLRRL
jgi:O-antigen/teichoic acid export membrane protein